MLLAPPFIPPSLSWKLISDCSSGFLRGQEIAGREGDVPGDAARLPWKNPEAVWEAEETSPTATSEPPTLPPFEMGEGEIPKNTETN